MTQDEIIGTLIAFSCAVIAVGADAQTEVRARFGTGLRGTAVVATLPGIGFLVFWGLVDAVLFVIFLGHKAWAKTAFNISVEENVVFTGIVVGLSAMLIIRTNLMTVGSIQVGGELAYTWSRSFLIDRLNRKRVADRQRFMRQYRPTCRNIAAYPKYFSSLEAVLIPLANGSPAKDRILGQLSDIKRGLADANLDASARESLTGLAYDYFGPEIVDDWAKDEDHGNK